MSSHSGTSPPAEHQCDAPPQQSTDNDYQSLLIDDNAETSTPRRSSPIRPQTPEPQLNQQMADASAPGTPDALSPFDWDDFEVRYQSALDQADEREREILKEAEGLSNYFQSWAAAASVHDNERAAKRLQSRRRFVNLSEEKLSQKQQHYEEVVRAFESALALLRSS